MQNFFARRDPWGNGLSLWVLVGMLFAAPLVLAALKGIRLNNDVESWLPKDDREARVFAWYRRHFPVEDHILVTWDSSTPADPRIGRLVNRLSGSVDEDGIRRGGIPQIASVLTPGDVYSRIVDYGVDEDEAARRLQGTLIGGGLVKIRLTDAGRARRELVIERLRHRSAEELGIDLTIRPPLEAWFDNANSFDEPLDEFAESIDSEREDGPDLSALMGEIRPHDLQVGWDSLRPNSALLDRFLELTQQLRGAATSDEPDGQRLIEEGFLLPGSPVGLLVTLSDAGIADPETTVAAIRQAAAEVGVPPEELRLGGRSVTGVALNEAVKKASWDKTAQPHRRSVILLSGAVGIVLAFVFLRSLRLGLLVLAVSYYTTAITVALIPLSGGSMNMVLMVMPTLLNVLTLSGAIHVANYWRHAAHRDPRMAIIRATEMARQPCALASLTTAIGLLSLLSSNLTPVRQFGLYSAIGCLIALVMVLYALPTLLQIWRTAPPSAREVDTGMWKLLGRVLARHATTVSLVCLAALGVATYGLTRFQTETKVIRYFPDHSRLVQDTRALEQRLAGTATVETVVRFSQEAQRDLRFLERIEIVRQVESEIRRHPELSGTLSLATFQPVRQPPPDDAKTFQKIRYNKRSNEAERRIKSGESGAEAFLVVADEPTDLAEEGDGGLNAAGEELWRITAQASVITDSDYLKLTDELHACVQSITRLHPGTQHVVTGTVPLFLRTQHAVLESLIASFGLAFAVIAFVMVLLLRNPLAGLISMLPNLLPVGLVFGLISWFDFRVDVGSMVTASVALGIAVDGTLHLLTWFREGIRSGLSRQEAMIRALTHCGPAMWQTSAAVGIGLLMLYPAELLLISRFGWLMAALIGAALVGDLVFLPALMVGPLGRLMERSIRQADEDPEQTPHSSPEAAAQLQPHFQTTRRRARSRKGLR